MAASKAKMKSENESNNEMKISKLSKYQEMKIMAKA